MSQARLTLDSQAKMAMLHISLFSSDAGIKHISSFDNAREHARPACHRKRNVMNLGKDTE